MRDLRRKIRESICNQAVASNPMDRDRFTHIKIFDALEAVMEVLGEPVWVENHNDDELHQFVPRGHRGWAVAIEPIEEEMSSCCKVIKNWNTFNEFKFCPTCGGKL